MWLLVVCFSLTQDKFDILPVCALARVSFTYLHTTIYTPPPNEIPGYAPEDTVSFWLFQRWFNCPWRKILATRRGVQVTGDNYDEFELWPDGDCRRVYDPTRSVDVGRHWTGWAMRNTNNHNHVVLKKSCLGLLVCSASQTTGCHVRLRPAICSKARQKQLGKSPVSLTFDFGLQCPVLTDWVNRARQLYKNISMLFLFPVKDGKLSTGVNATFNASCYG